uniref:Ymf74 n=1 Tax=Tetrahymena rostrata TaxID=5909 RepID=A0A650DE55_TETRO|nr:Ymf74 [Tetrahymena rostrata]QGS65255.1 Ymf74 [Tetrahymena rostrata]
MNYKKEVKYILKKRNYKFKKFKKLMLFSRYISNFLKNTVIFKKLNLKIKNNLLIKKYIYVNSITHGLDLKYDNLVVQNLYQKNIYSSNFFKNKHIIAKNDDININKLYKFLILVENNNYINFEINNNVNDYFLNNLNLFFSIIWEYQILIKQIYLLKLIFKCF